MDIATLALQTPSLAGCDEADLDQRLRFLGYLLLGGAAINYLDLGLSGFDGEDETLLKVTGALSSGYSGGPALVERDGEFSVVGVVIRQRFVQGSEPSSGQVSLIRSVDELPGLDWRPAARRVWLEDVRVAPLEPVEDLFSIDIDLRTIDFAGGQGLAMAYAYDAASGDPWHSQRDDLPSTPAGQFVLSASFEVSGLLGKRRITLHAPSQALLDAPDELAFRIVLWDVEAARALWRDTEWRRPQAAAGSISRPALQGPILTPTATMTATAQIGLSPATDTENPVPETPPAPTVTPSPEAEAVFCRALVGALRLRAGPATAYAAKGMLDPEADLTAQARNAASTWIEVWTPSGLRGWIYNSPTYIFCSGSVASLPIGNTPPLPAEEPPLPLRPTPTDVSPAANAPTTAGGPTTVGLIAPADGTNGRDLLNFSWQPDALLAGGQRFELVFWEPTKGQSPEEHGTAWSEADAATTVTLDAAARVPETMPGASGWGGSTPTAPTNASAILAAAGPSSCRRAVRTSRARSSHD